MKRAWLRKVVYIALSVTVIFLVGAFINMFLLGSALAVEVQEFEPISVSECAEALVLTEEGNYVLPDNYMNSLSKNGYWAMLINEAGEVVGDYYIPEEIPMHYSLSEVAMMSRWYVCDYPVKVWTVDGGLFVLGAPKDSTWKQMVEVSLDSFFFWPIWICLVIFSNFLVVLIVSGICMQKWYRRKDAARTEWIAAISHDVRTPLAMIMGYAANLEQDEQVNVPMREQATIIRKKSEELRNLIADLNLTNRLEYAMEPIQKENLSIQEILREVVADAINEDADEKYDFQITLNPQENQRIFRGDGQMIRRLFRNLVGNSIRHNPNGCNIQVKLEEKRHSCHIVIADDGRGFTKEQIAKFRKNRIDVGCGHGLGLNIVKQIVLAHGGNILIGNQRTGGSYCSIFLHLGAKRQIKLITEETVGQQNEKE